MSIVARKETRTAKSADRATRYPLTTVVTINRGNFSGTAKVDVIITTP